MALKVVMHVRVPADEPSYRNDDSEAHRPFYHLLDALTSINRDWLRRHPETPSLYTSGCRYINDRKGEENWYDIPNAIERRGGDCKVLAAWRCAELQVRGEAAMCTVFYRNLGPDSRLYHVQVLMPDGRIEDPSARLGMPGGALL